MTILDKANSQVHKLMSTFFDKEAPNYLETASLYAIIAQGRHLEAMLSVMHNHAHDPELKQLIREAIELRNKETISQCEHLLADRGGQLPNIHFIRRELIRDSLDIPEDARLTDEEIVLMLGAIAKAAQVALLTALHQSYQLDIAGVYRKQLDEGLDFNFRLLQLALHHGWLPHIAKIEH